MIMCPESVVLNLTTRSISPQFHTVYDDFFSTVTNNGEAVPPDWVNLVTNCSKMALDIIGKLHQSWWMNGLTPGIG